MVWFAPSLVSSQNYVQEQNGELTSSSVRTHRTNSLEWYTVLNTPENKRNEIHPFMEVLAFLDFSKEENKLTHQEQIYFSAMLPPGSYFLTVQNHDVLAGPALLLELRITNKNNETESTSGGLGSVASFGASRFELEFLISEYAFVSFQAINKGSMFRGCKASMSVRGPTSQGERQILFSGRCNKERALFTSESVFKEFSKKLVPPPRKWVDKLKFALCTMEDNAKMAASLLSAKSESILPVDVLYINENNKMDTIFIGNTEKAIKAVDGLLVLLSVGCLTNESFVKTINIAKNLKKPIVLMHNPLYPFPSVLEQPPSLRDDVFHNLALEIVEGYEVDCWNRIVKRVTGAIESLPDCIDIFLSHRQKTGREIALGLYVDFVIHDLEKIVEQTKLFVFILSPEIFDSEFCLAEFRAALRNNKKIVVVRKYSYVLPEELPEMWMPFAHILKDRDVLVWEAHYHKECVEKIIEMYDLLPNKNM